MKYVIWVLFLPGLLDAGTKIDPVLEALRMQSATYSVPLRILSAICFVESRHNPRALNKYDGGSPSYGLCQIKEKTARFMGFTGPINSLYQPDVNAAYA